MRTREPTPPPSWSRDRGSTASSRPTAHASTSPRPAGREHTRSWSCCTASPRCGGPGAHQLPRPRRGGLPRRRDGPARLRSVGQAAAGLRRADPHPDVAGRHPLARQRRTRWSSATGSAAPSRGRCRRYAARRDPCGRCALAAVHPTRMHTAAAARPLPAAARRPAGSPSSSCRGCPSAGSPAATWPSGACCASGAAPGWPTADDGRDVPGGDADPVRGAQRDGDAAVAGPVDPAGRRAALPRGDARPDRRPGAAGARDARPLPPGRRPSAPARYGRPTASRPSPAPGTSCRRRRPSGPPGCCWTGSARWTVRPAPDVRGLLDQRWRGHRVGLAEARTRGTSAPPGTRRRPDAAHGRSAARAR